MTIDELLAHQDWLRRLAGALVRDANDADDLVQETLVTALRSPPATDVHPRNWLAVVLRNSLATLRRSSKRRDARERAAARNEALPATLEALALASMQHELVEHVLKLDEPLREVVLLRFFADMPPREIAQQLGRPLSSVKGSLQRGLAKLRDELDARRGGRAEWLAILGPFASTAPHVTAATAWMGAAALVLIGAVAWMSVQYENDSPRTALAESTASHALQAPSTTTLENAHAPGTEPARAPLSPEKPANAAAPVRTSNAASTRARFVGLDGRPLPGLRVRIVDRDPLRWSDAGETVIIGPNVWLEVSPEERSRLRASPDELERFVARSFGDPAAGRALILGTPIPERVMTTDANGEIRVDRARGRVTFAAEGLALLSTGRTHHDHGYDDLTCVMTPTRTLRGRVVDAEGRGVPNASVEIEFDAKYLLDLPVGSFQSVDRGAPRTRSDEDGRFELGSLPRIQVAGCTVEVEARIVRIPRTVTVEDLDAGTNMVLTVPAPLQVRAALITPLIGHVVRPDGSPARRARLADVAQYVDADEDGRFEWKHARNRTLWAFERGYGYAVIESADALRSTDAGVEIALSNPLGSIEGVVLDERRLPAAGVTVRIDEAMSVFGMRESIEAFLQGSRALQTETDASGRFRFDGLLAREYTLQAEYEHQSTTPVPAAPSASPVTIELPSVQRLELVRGRAFTLEGEPLMVRTAAVVARDAAQDAVHGTTSFNGEFTVKHIVCPHPVLVVIADGHIPVRRELDETSVEQPIELRLAPACRVRISIPAHMRADALCVRDASNEELDVFTAPTSLLAPRKRWTVGAEPIPQLFVSKLATEIVLLREGEVVARRSLRPDPDGITRVDF